MSESIHYTPEERQAVINRIVEILEKIGVVPPENKESESMEVDNHV